MSDFPWTPQTATWAPKKDAPRGTSANDGKAPSLIPGATLAVFIEPKSVAWATQKFGVEVERQPYLLVLAYEDGQVLQMGDFLTLNGEPLEVSMACQLHDYGDGYRHAETMLLGKRTGGRG